MAGTDNDVKLSPEEQAIMKAGRQQTLDMIKQMQAGGGALHLATVDELVPDKGFESVTMVIPKAFNLTLKDRTQVKFPAGPHEVPQVYKGESLAGDGKDNKPHWYISAHGCTQYAPKKAAAAAPDDDDGKDKGSKNGGKGKGADK